MATRIYLPSSGTAPLGSLAVDSQWELSGSLVRLPCDTVKSNTNLTQKSGVWSSTTTQQWVWAQFQSPPMVAGYSWTTGDTTSMVIKVAEAAAQVDSHLCYVIRVVNSTGSVVRGTVGSHLTTSTEYPTSLAAIATRIHDARVTGASNFTSQIGDRIIIEIGHHGVSPTLNWVYHNYGDPSATEDYALLAGETTDLCPWVELSTTVAFHIYATGQNTVHAITSGNITLDAHNPIEPVTLTVQDIAQTQTSDSVILTAYVPTFTLEVQDATQTQTSDNIILTEHAPSFTLEVQDGSHSQTSGNIDLIQHQVLITQDTTHYQTSENVVLAQNYGNLVLQGTIHYQTSENVVLTQHQLLIIQSTIHSQTSGNINLIQASNLIINSAMQGQSINILLPNTLFFDDFESGNTNKWSAIVDDGGDLSITSQAAIRGNYGLNVLINDYNEKSITDYTPFNETRYRARFYLNPNSVTIEQYQNLFVYNVFREDFVNDYSLILTDSSTNKTDYGIFLVYWDDANVNHNCAFQSISDVPHSIEIDYKTSSGAGANDGYIRLYIDNILVFNTENIDNDTRTVGSIRLGAEFWWAGTYSGTIYFDDFSSNNDGSPLGEAGNLPLKQHQILALVNAQQLQTSENILLSQKYTLAVVNNLVQTQTSDNIILTQHFILVLFTAVQIMTSNNVSLGGGGLPIYMMHYIRLRSK